jgi:hypothetical protein
MRREILCRLAGTDAETFKSMSKRDELPFGGEEGREIGDYTLNEALMLRVALDLRGAAMPRAELGRSLRALGRDWSKVWARAKEVADASKPDLYFGIATARSEDGQVWAGLEFGTLGEIEQHAEESRGAHEVGSDAYARRVYRHRRYWSANDVKRFGGARLAITALSLSNVSQAFRDLVARANSEGVDVPPDFLEFFGA